MLRKLRFLLLLLLIAPAIAQNSHRGPITFTSAGTDLSNQQNGLIQYHQVTWTTTGSPGTCTIAIDSSSNGTTWTTGGIIANQDCTSTNSSAVTAGSANFVRIDLTALSGGSTPTVVANYNGWINNPSGGGGGGGGISGSTNPGQLVFGGSTANTLAPGDLSGDVNTSGNGTVTVTQASGSFTANGPITGTSFSTPSGLMYFSGNTTSSTNCPVTTSGQVGFCAVNDSPVGTGDAFSVSVDGGLYNPLMYAAGANTIGQLVMGLVSPPPVTLVTPVTTSGSLAAGTYNYGVSATSGTGSFQSETTLGTEFSNALGSTGSMTVTLTPQPGASGYCIYRGSPGAELQLACVTGGSTSIYNDDGSASLATASITAYSITSNVATFTASNSYKAGQNVVLSGFGTSTFLNGHTVVVLSTGLSGSQFEANFTHTCSPTCSATESGSAVPPSPQTINRTNSIIFSRLQSQGSSGAPTFGGNINFGTSDSIVFGSNSTTASTCGSPAVNCVYALRQNTGYTIVGDSDGVSFDLPSTGHGTFLLDHEIAAPANPAANVDLLYMDSTTHQLTCLNHSGTSCLPAGGGGGGVTATGSPSANQMASFASSSSIQPATAHQVIGPLTCADSSGSGTAQSCSTTPTFAPASGDEIIYSTTTANTGDVTVNVNSSTAAHVRKMLGQTTLSAGDLPANVPVPMIYDGTYWELFTSNLSTILAGDGSDGAVEATTGGSGLTCLGSAASSTYTMSRDCFFTTLIVDSGVTIKTNGYRVLASVSITNAGTFTNSGGTPSTAGSATGTNHATGGTAGGAGTIGASGTLPAPAANVAGKVGTTGTTSAGTNGTQGTSGAATAHSLINTTPNVGSAGGNGGSGVSGSGGTGGAVGTNGSSTLDNWSIHELRLATTLYNPVVNVIQLAGTAGGGGSGASGSGDGTNAGGGGGGSGGSGGNAGDMVFIAPIITLNSGSAFTATGGTGGSGGAGGTPTTGNCGGGGGGAGGNGGNGGVIVRVSRLLINNSNTDTVTGGSGGAGGAAGTGVGSGGNGTGGAGISGVAGLNGQVYNITLP